MSVSSQAILDGLQLAWQALAQMESDYRAAQTRWHEARQKVSTPPLLPPLDEVALLNPWLARIEDAAHTARWDALEFQRWVERVTDLRQRIRAVDEVAQNRLQERADLRGLLGALRAKAQALGKAEHSSVVQLAVQAERLLALRPTPMTELQRVVTRLAACLAEEGTV